MIQKQIDARDEYIKELVMTIENEVHNGHCIIERYKKNVKAIADADKEAKNGGC